MKNNTFFSPRYLIFILITLAAPFFAVAAVEPLTVQGNRILAGGEVKSFAGTSLFWSNNGWGGERYYNADVVRWLKTDWQSSIVRAAMGVENEGGYLADPAANTAKVRAVVEAAIANDMYVIIDWHSHNAELYRDQAIAFFETMARDYGHHPNVIYEIYNEPVQSSWDNTIKPYAEALIGAIRAIDRDNLIIVGTRQWSQRVDEAARNPITGFANIAYTLHFYAGDHFHTQRAWAQEALDRGIALFVTEWGTVNANGDGGVNESNTEAWVNFMRDHHISHANWAINDKIEGASALPPGASPSGGWDTLTASGDKVRAIVREWPYKSGGSGPLPNSIVIQAEDFAQAHCARLENTGDIGGGQNVGWLDPGDWLSYPEVTLPVTGTYIVEYRVASRDNGGSLWFEEAGGSPAYGALSFAPTGGWQTWTTVQHEVELTAGRHRFGIAVSSGGWNLNWIKITPK